MPAIVTSLRKIKQYCNKSARRRATWIKRNKHKQTRRAVRQCLHTQGADWDARMPVKPASSWDVL